MKNSSTFKMRFLLFSMATLWFSATLQSQQTTLARWTFNGTTEPTTGASKATLVGGTTTHSATLADGWRVTTFPGQSQLSGTAGVAFFVSTSGYQNITINLQHYASNTASRWASFEYTTNGGQTWKPLRNNNAGLSPGEIYYPFSLSFAGIEEANNNADFGIRIVSIFSPVTFSDGLGNAFYPNAAYHRARETGGTPYAGSGNWRFKDVTFTGDLLPADKAYFYQPGTDIKLLSSWNSAPDGSGNTPASFNLDNTTWRIEEDAVLEGQLNISGLNSRVVVSGDNLDIKTLILLPDSKLDAAIDVEEAGQLNIMTNNYPILGIMHPGSNVAFTSGTKVIPYHDYFSLTIVDANPVFSAAPDQTIKIRGGITLTGDVVFPDARGGSEYNFHFYGPWLQNISTNGNVLRAYNMIFEKTEGLVRTTTTSRISSDNQLTFNFSGTALFEDQGATIYAGNSVNIAGSPSNFNFTGTLILAGIEPGVVRGAGTANNFNIRESSTLNTNPKAALNNLIVRVANTGGEFRFRDGTSNLFEIKGNLIVEAQANGRIRFYGNDVKIGGNLIIEEGFKGVIDIIENLMFAGNTTQTISLALPTQAKKLNINNSINIVKGHLIAIDLLDATKSPATGIDGVLVANPSTAITGISADAYTIGNMGYRVSAPVPADLIFHTGTTEQYMPLKMQLSHVNPTQVIHYARAADSGLPDLGLPAGVESVFAGYYFHVYLDPAAGIENGKIFFPLLPGIIEIDPSMFRVLRAGNQNWVNLGGVVNDGHIESEVPFSQGGWFVLGVYNPGSSSSILSFRFDVLNPPVAGDINEDAKTITLRVPFGTDVTALVPVIEHNGSEISPSSGVAQNFTNSVQYMVTADDNSTSIYTVTVIILPIENDPPVVSNPVNLQNAIETGAPIVIDLSKVFTDPDGKPMSFKAESGRPVIASVNVSGNNLTINPLRRGDATITVQAIDDQQTSAFTTFRVLVYPKPLESATSRRFAFWDPNEPELTYPEGILFLQSNISDPGLDAPLEYAYYIPHDDYHADDEANIGFPYRNLRRSRINGLGDNGISFINTGRDRDLGGLLIALKTNHSAGVELKWTAGTILKNERIYGIRVQYRVGIEGPFQDLTDVNGEPTEVYIAGENGTIKNFVPVTLPQQLWQQDNLQLLFRYYHISGTSGARPQLRLDDIVIDYKVNVDRLELQNTRIYSFNKFIYLETSAEQKSLLEVFNLMGQKVYSSDTQGGGKQRFGTGLEDGIYIVRFTSGQGITTTKILLK